MNLRRALLACDTLHKGLSETDSEDLERAATMARSSEAIEVTDTFCDGVEKMLTMWSEERSRALGNMLADMVVAETYAGCASEGQPA